jgi:hypothetical protein
MHHIRRTLDQHTTGDQHFTMNVYLKHPGMGMGMISGLLRGLTRTFLDWYPVAFAQ